jgi:hypothetical protein
MFCLGVAVVRPEVLTAVSVKTSVFWGMMPFGLVE